MSERPDRAYQGLSSSHRSTMIVVDLLLLWGITRLAAVAPAQASLTSIKDPTTGTLLHA
jgi:hypothetical protein